MTTAAFAPLIPSGKDGSEDQATLKYLQTKTTELVEHLECKYPGDRRTQVLKVNLTEIKPLPEYASRTVTGGNFRVGTFYSYTGVIEISLRDKKGKAWPREVLLIFFLHEVGHALDSFVKLSDDHGESWRSHTLWLLNIATRELGWKVRMPCSYCTNYLMCNKELCPKCTWECTGKKAPSKRGVEKRPAEGFVSYPRPSYTRVCTQRDLPFAWWKNMCGAYETQNRLPARQRTQQLPEGGLQGRADCGAPTNGSSDTPPQPSPPTTDGSSPGIDVTENPSPSDSPADKPSSSTSDKPSGNKKCPEGKKKNDKGSCVNICGPGRKYDKNRPSGKRCVAGDKKKKK